LQRIGPGKDIKEANFKRNIMDIIPEEIYYPCFFTTKQ
jgi:hypothetical protein